ncbi:unnamed protein product [Malus baccata var. baccata]
MECGRIQIVIALCSLLLFPVVHGWGNDGHVTVCRIAQSRLSKAAADAVKQLLPDYAENDWSSLCIWADRVKFIFPWSSALHYINTPEVCNYQYSRDCKDEDGEKGRCVAGAINNYTTQLLTYNSQSSQPKCFASDKGGNTIDVHWYTRKQNLHHIWDDNIIETAEERFYDSNVEELIDAIKQNITTEWSDQVKGWETCSLNKKACPDVYASEGIKAACDWAYKGADEGSVLEDEYFLSRLPIVHKRLAQGGVRLAATLNRIFG